MEPLLPPPASKLLGWYDRNRRVFPWRALPGQTPDPYRVWLSEIMLQQTTTAAVAPYYEAWLLRFPDLAALAAAEDAAVMAAWAGLGYYARARNLLACARQVVQLGGFPRDLAGLRRLPGIGPYTAAAIAAIAFGVPVVPVDGNVERVVARLFAITAPLPGAKAALAQAAARLGAQPAAEARPSDFAQALFDLGATLCTPTRPACVLCPWRDGCAAQAGGIAETLPAKAPKAPRPHRHGVHFWVQDAAGRVLLRRRPPQGLLGGMTELPGPAWRGTPWPAAEALAAAPFPADWRLAGQVAHGLTHFTLGIDVYVAQLAAGQVSGVTEQDRELDGHWCPCEALPAQALPSVMQKCVRVARQFLAAS